MAPDDPPGGAPETPPEPSEPKFFEQFPREWRQSEEAKAFWDAKTPGDFLNRVTDMHRKLGRAVIVPDAKNPDPGEVTAFRSKLNLPTKEEELALDPAPYKDTIPDAEKGAGYFRKLFFSAGLNRTQATTLYKVFMDARKQGAEAQAAQAKAQSEAFDKKTLEIAGGDAEKAKAVDEQFRAILAKRYPSKTLIQKFAASGLLEDPEMLDHVLSLGKLLSDDRLDPGHQGGGKSEAVKKGAFGDSYNPQWVAQEAALRGHKA